MKARKFFLLAVLALPLAVACNNDSKQTDEPSGTDYQELTFTAGSATVQGIDVSFSEGDAISIFDGKANQKITATSSSSFTGTANAKADAFMAIYPYNASYKRTSGKVAVEIPASQKATAGSVDPSANFQVAYAKSTTETLGFVFMPAVLKLNIPAGNDIVSVQIASAGGEAICGSCSLELSESPKCEATGEGSTKITVTGTDINGDIYVAAIPGSVSGFTLSFTNSSDGRCEVAVSGAELMSGNISDLGTVSSFDWIEAANPNPTDVPKVVVCKATFEPADFNICHEPNLDYFEDEAFTYRTQWFGDAVMVDNLYKVSGNKNTNGWRFDNDTPGIWGRMQNCQQLNMMTDYTFTVNARLSNGNGNAYAGFQTYTDGILHEILGWAGDWESDEQWKEKSTSINSGSNFYADLYLGMWGDAGFWIEFDKFLVIPTGYDYEGTSTESTGSEVIGTITNATFDEISDLGKCVAWVAEDGTVKLAFSNVNVNGTVYPTAVANTESTDFTNIQISKFNKTSGVLDEIVPVEAGQLSVVPDEVFVKDGKTYMHYFATIAENSADEWTTDYASFAISEDGGKTWTASDKTWSGAGKFASAGFCNANGYTWMAGTYSGRDTGLWANMHCARIADGKDFTDPAAYEYWVNDGNTFFCEGDENGGGQQMLMTVGPRAEPAIIYNPKFDVYMMIYRADSMSALMYVDSKGPDATGRWHWSGEKFLTLDEEVGKLFDPSVLKVEEDGSIIFLATQL